jgi:hypothetical protein
MILFSLELKYSEIEVNIIANKKEAMPTETIYLPDTVDLLLPKKSPHTLEKHLGRMFP